MNACAEDSGMKNIFGGFPITFLFFVFCLLGSIHAETIHKEKNIMTPALLEQRGKQLHAEVIQVWENLKQSKSLRLTNDISETVTKFIPVGTSFADAEIILRGAGFNIWPRHNLNPPNKNSGKYDLAAGMDVELAGIYSADVGIFLWAKTPNASPNIVGRATGVISYTSL